MCSLGEGGRGEWGGGGTPEVQILHQNSHIPLAQIDLSPYLSLPIHDLLMNLAHLVLLYVLISRSQLGNGLFEPWDSNMVSQRIIA